MASLPADLNTLTVNQLKEHLSARKIEVKGKKADYVKALQEALDKEKSSAPSKSSGATPATKAETKKDTPVVDSDEVDVTGESEATASSTEKSKTDAIQNGVTSTNGASTEEHPSTDNSSGISEEEKKRKRAERFGIPVKEMSDESKKEQRMQRFGTQHQKPPVNLEKAKRLGLPIRGGAAAHFAPLNESAKPLGLDKGINKTWSKEEEDKKRKRAERFGLKQPSALPQAKKPKTEVTNSAPATNGAPTDQEAQ